MGNFAKIKLSENVLKCMPLKLDSIGKHCKHVISLVTVSLHKINIFKNICFAYLPTLVKSVARRTKKDYFEHPCFVEKRLGKKTKATFVKFVY